MVQITPHLEDHLPESIRLKVDDAGLGFERAKSMATEKARLHSKHAMLLSWYDRQKDRYFPQFECGGDKPPWIVYSESRGSNLKVDINDGDYIFFI